jgi:hypothetical protein
MTRCDGLQNAWAMVLVTLEHQKLKDLFMSARQETPARFTARLCRDIGADPDRGVQLTAAFPS